MKQVYSLFVALTKNWVRTKSGIFFSFLMPIFYLLLMMVIPHEDVMEIDPIKHILPGLIAAFIAINGIMGVTIGVTEYKINGTLKRLIASPLKKREWILANLVQQTLLAVLLVGVMVLLSIPTFNARVYLPFHTLMMVFLGAITFCSLGIFLAGIIEDKETAIGIANGIGIPMVVLSGVFIPLEVMPEWMQTVTKLLPVHYLYRALKEVMMLNNPGGLLKPFIILIVFTILFLFLAVKTVKWKDI